MGNLEKPTHKESSATFLARMVVSLLLALPLSSIDESKAKEVIKHVTAQQEKTPSIEKEQIYNAKKLIAETIKEKLPGKKFEITSTGGDLTSKRLGYDFLVKIEGKEFIIPIYSIYFTEVEKDESLGEYPIKKNVGLGTVKLRTYNEIRDSYTEVIRTTIEENLKTASLEEPITEFEVVRVAREKGLSIGENKLLELLKKPEHEKPLIIDVRQRGEFGNPKFGEIVLQGKTNNVLKIQTVSDPTNLDPIIKFPGIEDAIRFRLSAENAGELPPEELKEIIKKRLGENQGRPIIVICEKGVRSSNTALSLSDQYGFDNVRTLAGGVARAESEELIEALTGKNKK